jgi:hypothetical protein
MCQVAYLVTAGFADAPWPYICFIPDWSIFGLAVLGDWAVMFSSKKHVSFLYNCVDY